MAENKQSIPNDGIGRQEEEVRDLFNLLTKNQPAERLQASPTAAVESPKAVEAAPAAVEETAPPAAPAAEESVIEPKQPMAEEPVAEEPATEVTPAVEEQPAPAPQPPTPSPFAARERRAFIIDEEDEEDIGLELPPLVFTSYEEEDEDEEDEFDDYGHFILPGDADEADYEVDEAPAQRRNPLLVFWNALRGNVPLPCDSKPEIVRKSVFWLSLVVVTGALTYILYNVWWLPAFTKGMYGDLEQEYHPEIIGVVEDAGYPQEMQLSFKALYDRNNETRGWLSFHASGNRDFLNIEYPIMYSGDNDKYLTTDFNGNKNKNGALFFDMRAKLDSIDDTNTSLIVYGHNMASGQMLAGLNKFIGNVNNVRVAPTMTMNTLFSSGQYKVFAVVITDESAQPQYYYNVRRTQFSSDEDYLSYIENLRARSLFDYPVDVQAGDELLLLSTCTVPSSAKIRNGRLTVIARKVRDGESTAVNTSAIIKNEDVIMPYAWYTLQDKQPHVFYSSGVVIAPNTTSTSTTNELDWGTITHIEGSTTLPSDYATGTTTLTDSASTTGSTTLTSAPSSSGSTAAPSSSSSSSATSSSVSTTESTTSTTESTTSTTESTTSTTESTASTTENTTTTTTTAAEEEPPATQE